MGDYIIQAADGLDDETAEEICDLHTLCFEDNAPPINPIFGWWWLVYHENIAIGFAGFVVSTWYERGQNYCFFKRAGVLPAHRGRGLQRRLLRVREVAAKRLGFTGALTYTINNPESANNLARCGFKMFTPPHPWTDDPATLHWRKNF